LQAYGENENSNSNKDGFVMPLVPIIYTNYTELQK